MHYVEITKDRLLDTDKICKQEMHNVAKTCIEMSAFLNAEIFIDASHFTIKAPMNQSGTRALIWSKIGDADEATFWSDGIAMNKVHDFFDLVDDVVGLIGEDVKTLREILKEKQKTY